MAGQCAIQLDGIQYLPINPEGVRNRAFIIAKYNLQHLIILIESGNRSQAVNKTLYAIMFHIVTLRLRCRYDSETHRIIGELLAKVIGEILDYAFLRYDRDLKAHRCVLLSGIQYIRTDFPEISEQLIYSGTVDAFIRNTNRGETKRNSTRLSLDKNAEFKLITGWFKDECFPPPNHHWWKREMIDLEYAQYYEYSIPFGGKRIRYRCLLATIDEIDELPINPDGPHNIDLIHVQYNLQHIIILIESGNNSQAFYNAIFAVLYHIMSFRLKYRWDKQMYGVFHELIAKAIPHFPEFLRRYNNFSKPYPSVLLSGIQYIRDDFPELSESLIYSEDVDRLIQETIRSNAVYSPEYMDWRQLPKVKRHFMDKRYPPRHHTWWSREMYDSDYAEYYRSLRKLCCLRVSNCCFNTLMYILLSICFIALPVVAWLFALVMAHFIHIHVH